MKIAIDGRGINWYRGTGIGTYTENLVRELIGMDKENEYFLFWSGEYDESFQKENCHLIMASRKHTRFFEQQYIPHFLKDEAIDIYHVPQNGIGLKSLTNSKNVVTIHDLIPYISPETVGRGYLLRFLREMPSIIQDSNCILTVSEWSKKDILKYFPIDANKIFVTPLAANSKYKPLDKEYCQKLLKEKYNIDKDFILYVGGFSPRKNVKLLVDAFISSFENLDKEYYLVLPGSVKDEGQKLMDYVNMSPVKDKVKFLGFCEEDMLPILYNGCSLFVYPSTYEGFGLPPLEAMCCGAPVITSNLTSIPEVVGDGGLIINPNLYELCNSLERVLNTPFLREELISSSLRQAKNFSWKFTAEKTLEAYKNLIL